MWKANIPHTHLAEEKSDQHWMVVNGEKINFPGGGTHFHNGADKYIVALSKVGSCYYSLLKFFVMFYQIFFLVVSFNLLS